LLRSVRFLLPPFCFFLFASRSTREVAMDFHEARGTDFHRKERIDYTLVRSLETQNREFCSCFYFFFSREQNISQRCHCRFIRFVMLYRNVKTGVTFNRPSKPKNARSFRILSDSRVNCTEIAERLELFWSVWLHYILLEEVWLPKYEYFSRNLTTNSGFCRFFIFFRYAIGVVDSASAEDII